MKAFLNLKIFAKLGIIYNLLMVVILVIAVGSYIFFGFLNRDTQRAYEELLVPLKSLADISETYQLIRGDTYQYLLFRDQEQAAAQESIVKNASKINDLLSAFSQDQLTPEEKTQFERFQSSWAKYQQAIQNIISDAAAGNEPAAQQSLLDGAAYQASIEGQDALDQLRASKLQASEQLREHSRSLHNQATAMVIILTALGILIGIASSFVINNSVVRPLRRMAEAALGIAEGRLDPSTQIDIERKDEIGAVASAFNSTAGRMRELLQKEHEQSAYQQKTIEQYVAHMARFAAGDHAARLRISENGHHGSDALVILGRNLNQMTDQLARMILQMREAAGDLTQTSAEIRAVTTQQSASAAEQSAAISETSITIEEVKAIAGQSAQRSQDMTAAANRTLMVSQAGQIALQDTIDSMYHIKQRVQGIAENILALSEQTQLIADITTTVNQIATQSNLLALNASVEAARAGEAGKGFAIVAAEVRHLAEESRQATAQVKDILTEIQKATNITVMATEEGIKGVERGVQLALQSKEAIAHLTSVIEDNANASTQVAAGSQQQATGIDQVALAIRNINQATQQNLASTRQAENAAQTLSQLAKKLNEILN